MVRKMNVTLCLLLVIALLAGCTANNTASTEDSSALTESASATNNQLTTSGEITDSEEAIVDNSEFNLHGVTYLWEEGHMPATTAYPQSNSEYSDPPDFRPNMMYYPAKEGGDIKGAVMICAGGAFQFRSPGDEAPVAEGLNELGYHCFVVEYRLRPYTQEEAALDLARAVRYVRSHAESLGIDEDNIATIGFSAGGILCGEQALNFTGLIDGTVLDESYIPDELDKISADVSAVGMIYSFYGRLSVASTDVERFAASDLPPTYFLYGSNEVFRSQIEACANATRQAGVPTESRILEGWQHGFGARGDWFEGFDAWLSPVFDATET
jgi:acetyl esterase/lipase